MKRGLQTGLTFLATLLLVVAVSGCAASKRLMTCRAAEKRAHVAFFDATGLEPDVRGKIVAEIRARDPDLEFLRGELSAEAPSTQGWYCIVPDLKVARPHEKSYEYGPLQVVILNTEGPVAPDSTTYRRLLEDLSLSRKPWKVVLMRKPVFSIRADRELLPLAQLFERERVALVVSGDSRAYHRTAPIGSSAERAVRYVETGDGRMTSQPEESRPAWRTRSFTGPHFSILDVTADRFRWTVYDRNGRLIDTLIFTSESSPDSEFRFFSVSEILAGEKAKEDD